MQPIRYQSDDDHDDDDDDDDDNDDNDALNYSLRKSQGK